ncbi:hypothetical protein tpqmel_1015 [Candidatus Gastranaerophilus sp. (ex Termes propinquus)]|nr:hypothetical protein tpqmel_1015 [Candidatus Gastranaerophilus sp. (ex Termes propinquus)]
MTISPVNGNNYNAYTNTSPQGSPQNTSSDVSIFQNYSGGGQGTSPNISAQQFNQQSDTDRWKTRAQELNGKVQKMAQQIKKLKKSISEANKDGSDSKVSDLNMEKLKVEGKYRIAASEATSAQNSYKKALSADNAASLEINPFQSS